MTDLILLLIIILFGLWGWHSGLIQVLSSFGAFIIAYQLGRHYSAQLAHQLTALIPGLSPSDSSNQVLALISLIIDTNAAANRLVQIILFIIIFIVVNWLIRLLARALSGLLGGTILGRIDHAIGSLIALVVGIILIVIIDNIIFPSLINIGISALSPWHAYLRSSEIILPLIYDIPQLL